MKRSNKIISLEYLQKLVKQQEEKDEKEKKIKMYIVNDEFVQITNKGI